MNQFIAHDLIGCYSNGTKYISRSLKIQTTISFPNKKNAITKSAFVVVSLKVVFFLRLLMVDGHYTAILRLHHLHRISQPLIYYI